MRDVGKQAWVFMPSRAIKGGFLNAPDRDNNEITTWKAELILLRFFFIWLLSTTSKLSSSKWCRQLRNRREDNENSLLSHFANKRFKYSCDRV